jgi:isoquinoline 1-oxidoreductase beta subunit
MEGLDKQGAVVPATKGDAKKALSEAAKKVEAVYYVPFVAHAPMEPLNCTAYVQEDRCDVWVPTQTQIGTRMAAAGVTKLPPDKVHVHTTLLGCGYGRRARAEWVVDAVSCSKAAGKPVKVVWTREEDIKNHFFRAATCQKLQAGLDAQGQVVGWSHKVACSSILRFSNPAAIKNGVDIQPLGHLRLGPDPVFSRTAYEFPNYYLEQWL